jgi:nucleotide-binding universal stress UspA family protein
MMEAAFLRRREQSMPTVETFIPERKLPKLSLNTILFATDFSPASENAFRFASRLAASYKSTLLIVHVVPSPSEAVTEHRICDKDQQIRAEAQKKLSHVGAQDRLRAISHQEILLEGEPDEALLAYLKDKEVDLLVVGTHGRKGLADVLIGSVADSVFRQADCPVITAGPRTQLAETAESKIEHILYATDLAGSHHALGFALALARQNHASLTLMHVLEGTGVLPFDVPQQWADDAKLKLQRLVSDVPEIEDVVVDFKVEFGRPAASIVQAAAAAKTDLIVLGVRPGTKSSHTPWAIAHQVVSTASCPVLTVR